MAEHAVSRAVCQGSAICPAGCVNACALAEKLSRRYDGETIRIGVYGCPNCCFRAGHCKKQFDLKVYGGQEVRPNDSACIHCGACVRKCPSKALSLQNGKIRLAAEQCLRCGSCVRVCPVCAFSAENGYLLERTKEEAKHLQFFSDEAELYYQLDQELGRK